MVGSIVIAGMVVAEPLDHQSELQTRSPNATSNLSVEMAGMEALRKELEDSHALLEETMAELKVTPEERAVLVEAWLEDSALKKETIEEMQRSMSGGTANGGVSDVIIEHVPIPPNCSPLQRDILEMENEILDFHNTLKREQVTPEDRAVRIEAFLSYNDYALSRLEDYRIELSTEAHGPPTKATPLESVREASQEELQRINEIREILIEAEELNPESRALLIEANLNKLNQLQELLISSDSRSQEDGHHQSGTQNEDQNNTNKSLR